MAVEYADLRAALAIVDGTVTVDPARLTPNLQALWGAAFAGAPLVIASAQPGPGDGGGSVVVAGLAPFLQSRPVPVLLRATLDGSGQVHVHLLYTLRGATPPPDAWTFSDSLPDLPTVVDAGHPGGVVLLDQLDIFDTVGVIVDQAQTDPAGVALQAGINVISQLRPGGALGTLESVLGQTEAVTLAGTIVPPVAGTPAVPPLGDFDYPWDRPDPVPGITLAAALTHPAIPLVGRLVLQEAALRIYSGPSQAWERANPTFTAVQAYTATLAVPSARLTARVTAEIELGSGTLVLDCDFGGGEPQAGLTLADLADLAGTGDLALALPAGLEKMGTGVGRLALIDAALGLSLSASGFTVTFAALRCGFPDLHWTVWDPELVVSSVVARFEVAQPFTSPQASVRIDGTIQVLGTPVLVGASTADGFTVYATLGAQADLHLPALLQTYAPGVPAPSDLTIDRLNLTVVPGTSYEMDLAMADTPNPWVIPLGPTSLQVSDLELWLRYAGGLSGFFSGQLGIGGVTLAATYTIPGDVQLRGAFPTVRLSQMLALISGAAPLPAGFDLAFTDTSVLIQKQGDSFVFLAATDLAGFGLFALTVRHGSEGWGFAAGLDIGQGRTAQLPALGPLAPLIAAVDLEQLVLVVSTFDDPGFTFPDAALFDDAHLQGSLKPAGPAGVRQGFNLLGSWRLDPASRLQSLLRGLLGIEAASLVIVLQVSLPDPGQNSALFAEISVQLQGWDLDGRFGVRLRGDTPELFVSGALQVAIQGQQRTFYVESSLVANGVFIAGSFTGGSPVTISIGGVDLFQIGDLAVAVGSDFEGIPSLGVAGTIAQGDFSSSLAVFVNSAEPQKSLVAGSISNLHLGDVLRTLSGGATSELTAVLDLIGIAGTRTFSIPGALGDDLDGLRFAGVAAAFAQNGVTIPSALPGLFLATGTPGSTWFLTALVGDDEVRHYTLQRSGEQIAVTLEAQLYCVPETTNLGQLSFRGPQFFLNGAIRLFGLQAEATLTIEPARGFAVDAAMSPVVIYRESFFSITSTTDPTQGPRVSGATYTQPDQADPQLRPAHLLLDGRVEILGLQRQAYVAATSDGFVFDIGGDVQPAVRLDAHGSFAGLDAFKFGGSAQVGVGTIDLGPLGQVAVDTGADAALDLGLQDAAVWARMGIGFEVGGEAHKVEAQLDATGSQLADIAAFVLQQIKEFLTHLFSDATTWLKAVASGAVQGVEDAVAVLRQVFGKTEEEALQLYNAVMEDAQKVCALTRAALLL